ncbi:MAG: hypothetical protein ACF8AM_17910 [Rhodopirellula sp. JB055]|uniref:hypothetical protein n=1 Tax=Rhodopirellula sp. JB055 TaxID=3342846 RepID=UPI00370B6B49
MFASALHEEGEVARCLRWYSITARALIDRAAARVNRSGATPSRNDIMDNETGIVEETKKVVTDKDRKLGEEAPGTPFMLVALSYLAVLAVVAGVVAMIMWAGN